MNDAALDRARQSWRAAEARLYPLAMTDVDGYQRALVLVAAMCAQLRATPPPPTTSPACQHEAAQFVAVGLRRDGHDRPRPRHRRSLRIGGACPRP